MSDPAPAAIADLVALLDVAEIAPDRFAGARHPGGKGRVFGGQVVAQALMAAWATAPAGRTAHSLHAYFMRPGDEAEPILYDVARDFDGGSFSTRRVIASQQGRPILTLVASFQRAEDGFSHATPMPAVPPPAALPDASGVAVPPPLAHFLKRFAAFELRPVDPRVQLDPAPRAPVNHSWFRLVAPVLDDAALRSAILAYISDFGLLTTATLPHGVRLFRGELQAASLDHAIWFHTVPPLDQWLLYAMDSPWAGGGRGLARGAIYSESGALVASVIQEGLLRPLRPKG